VALALGTIEIYGIPTAMEVADAMCKSARVTLVGFENTDAGRLTVLIRGTVGDVETAVRSGLAAISKVNGGKLLSHHIIPRPHKNLEVVLPIGLSEDIESIRDIVFPPPLSP
jgi:carbon dioxide concentrating mechanism protein CcmK